LFRAFDPVKGKIAQTSESFDDHEEALKWQKILDRVGPEQARKILYAQLREASSDVLTLVDWCRTHIKSRTGIEKGTRNKYTGYVENDIEPYFSAMLPLQAVCAYGSEEISPVQEWVRYMEEERDFSAKTIANKHGFLSGALKAAAKRRPPLLPFNPCEDTKLPDRHFEAAFLEVEEFALLYALTGQRWRAQVLLRVTTGARPSEVTAANVGDIGRYLDRDGVLHHTFRIAKAWKYTGSNKDEKLGTTKSKKGTRTVDVPVETVAELDLGRPKTHLLFPTQDGGRITAQRFHNDCWGPILSALEDLLTKRPPELVARLVIELNTTQDSLFDVAASLSAKKPRPYDLRHTCASWMINGGASLSDVQEHMGHESIQTTKDIYGHLDRHAGRRATAALSGALARTVIGQGQKIAI
jgi:integrase